MSETYRLRLGGFSGVILAVMLIAGFALDFAIIFTTRGQPLLNPENISTELLRAKGSTVWLVEAWVYTLMVVPVPPFMLAIYWILRAENDRGLPAVGLFASALFWIFHTLHNLSMLTVVQDLVPRYVVAPQESRLAIEAVATALLGFANAAFNIGKGVGALFFVGSLAAFGGATLLTSRLPRWTGYLALAASFLGLLAYLQFISEVFVFVGLLGWVIHIVWVIAMTVGLLRSSSS